MNNYKRIVIKVGTRLLDSPNNIFNRPLVEELVRQIATLHQKGVEILLVTSGAIGAGMRQLGWTTRPKTIPDRQALAAIGQGRLMNLYEEIFAKYNLKVAQVLLTESDLNDRRRYLNARNTLLRLLEWKVIPIINENDTVATEELKIGDNDTLSARIASKVEADLLIILTDVDGLFDSNPKKNPDARLISCIEKINPELEKKITKEGASSSELGTGGMITKLQAAKIATSSGITMYIANGNCSDVILRIFSGENIGTKFLAQQNRKLSLRERWIAYGKTLSSKNLIMVDEGAKEAIIKHGKSLLPSGVIKVEGSFKAGDLVRIVDEKKQEFARGLSNYSSEEISKIKGLKSTQIESVLGFKPYDEVVHRDNLVLLS